MGMSTHVVAIRPPDDKWLKMKEAYESCRTAGVEPPKKVLDFFEGEEPDPAGVEVGSAGLRDDRMPRWVSQLKVECMDGFEVDVTKLPKDVTIVRFYNSY